MSKSPYFDLGQRDMEHEYNGTLHYLVIKDHHKVLGELLKLYKGSDVLQINSKNHRNKTALHLACELSHNKCITLLL